MDNNVEIRNFHVISKHNNKSTEITNLNNICIDTIKTIQQANNSSQSITHNKIETSHSFFFNNISSLDSGENFYLLNF